MKQLVISSIFLFSLQICFTQNQKIKDPYSGLETELSANNDYLIVTNIKTGSPADLVSLKLGDRIYKINNINVNEIPNCNDYFQSNKGEWLNITAKRGAGDSFVINIPRVSVDLFSERYNTEGLLFNILPIFQGTNINSDSNKELYQNIEDIVKTSENPDAYDVEPPINNYIKRLRYSLRKNIKKYTSVTTLSDKEKNIENLRTFDFEYTSKDDPLMEKTLLNDLGKQLQELGLKRDQNNPDILIIISYYSGQKEQYIPPQQIVSTRIQNYFNWYWGYIPVPVTESKTQTGYTKYTYLTNISLKFLETKEIETSKVPPVVWSASYSEVSDEKTFLSDCSKEIFKYLLLQFPEVVNENCEHLVVNNYTFTGIVYDSDNLTFIADVIPGSPAYKTGLEKGDEIIKINKYKFSKTLRIDDGYNYFYSGMNYIFINSDFRDANPQLLPPIKSQLPGYKNSENKPVVFEINRNKKKMTFEVMPEFKKVVYFDDKGFTID